MTPVTAANISTGEIVGSVTWRNRCHAPGAVDAPPPRTGRLGTSSSAARKITITSPMPHSAEQRQRRLGPGRVVEPARPVDADLRERRVDRAGGRVEQEDERERRRPPAGPATAGRRACGRCRAPRLSVGEQHAPCPGRTSIRAGTMTTTSHSVFRTRARHDGSCEQVAGSCARPTALSGANRSNLVEGEVDGREQRVDEEAPRCPTSHGDSHETRRRGSRRAAGA